MSVEKSIPLDVKQLNESINKDLILSEDWIFLLEILKESLESGNIHFKIRNSILSFERLLENKGFFRPQILVYFANENANTKNAKVYKLFYFNKRDYETDEEIKSMKRNEFIMRYWENKKLVEFSVFIENIAVIKTKIGEMKLKLDKEEDEHLLEYLFSLVYLYTIFVFDTIIKSHHIIIKVEERFKRDALAKNIYNRQALEEKINQLEKSNTKEEKMVIVFDLNNFKKYNDTYGHLEGDKAIVKMAEVLEKYFRRDDFVARYGGDEFVVIADKMNEKVLGEKIKKIKREYEKNFANKKVKVSFAVGWSIWKKGRGKKIKEIIKKADERMYWNKVNMKRLKINS